MTKDKFLLLLRERLAALPQSEVEERLAFYSEAIDDRIEEGLCEEEAVLAMGPVDEIAAQIIPACCATTPKRRMTAWEIALLVLGSPVWLSLLVAAFAVVLSVYASAWSVIVSLWAVFVSVAACAIGGTVAGLSLIGTGSILSGAALVAVSVICAGCTIFLFFGCKAVTKGILWLTKKFAIWIKLSFKKGGRA